MGSAEERCVRIGQYVTLIDQFEKRYVVHIENETKKIKGLGVYNTSKLADRRYGEVVRIGSKRFTILEPNLVDHLETLTRRAQIITPKDAAQILLQCALFDGATVIEGGVGSGALTTVLAYAVAPTGKVISYEQREKFARIAQRNLDRTQQAHLVEIKIGDIAAGIEEREVDAVILDIPTPQEVVASAYEALRVGGTFASYVPTMNQVERVVRELRGYDFGEIRTLETIQREIEVGKGGVRPAFEMLGHTGYITFARKYH